jgi:N-methylhydantoinase A
VAGELLRREGVADEGITLQRSVDLKYYPQTSYINLPVPEGRIDQAVVDALVERFLERHADEFGYSVGLDLTSVEFVNARLTAFAPAPVGELVRDEHEGDAARAEMGTREVHFIEAGGWSETTLYDRSRLFAGAELEGPAIVHEADSTTVIPPGARASVDPYRNLIIDVREVTRI